MPRNREEVDLFFCSVTPLQNGEYENVNQGDYIAWFLKFARHYQRLVKDDGSFVLDIGGAWTPRQATRSLYHYKACACCVRDSRWRALSMMATSHKAT